MKAQCILAVAATVTLIALSGCSQAEPLSIDEGIPHYRALTKELAAALSAEFPGVEWTREGADNTIVPDYRS